MADAYKGLTVKIGADTSSLSSALRKARSEASGVSAELRKLEKALKLDPGNTKLLAQQQEDYRKQIKATEKQLELYRKAEEQIGKDGMSSEQWTKLQSDIVIAEQKLKGYKQAIADSVIQQTAANSVLGKTGAKLEEIGTRFDGVSRKMGSIGASLTHTVTPAVAATGAAAFTLASDFETSMAQVAGALNDPTANMEELRELALKTGEDTIFSATEAGNAMVELAKGGLTEADIKGGALAATMALAAAGNMELADAANTVVQSMGAFHLEADQTGEAANALAGAAAASSAEVSDLTQGLSQCSAQADTVGWSIQDTAAVLGGFTDAGVKGSDAGTSLKTMLQRLAAPTDKAADLISDLGISVYDSEGHMLDASGVAQELQDKLGGLADKERAAALQTIFGSDATRAATIMMSLGADGVKKYTDATNDQAAAQRLADSQMGESERALEEMKGAVETAAIEFGTALSPAVVEAAGAIGEAAEAFSGMDDETQRSIIQTAAFVAGLGPALAILAKLVGIVKTFGKGLQNLAGFFAKVDVKTSEAGVSMKDYSAQAKKAETATKSQATAVKASSVAMGAAKTAAIGLAIAGILVLVDALRQSIQKAQEAERRSRDLEATMRGLEDAAAGATVRFEDEADAVSAANDAFAQSDLDQIIQDHKDLATSITEVNQSAATSVGLLSGYGDTVQDLAGKTDLTEEQVAELKLAVEGANDALGTSWTVAQDAEGAWQVMGDGAVIAADKVRELIDAQSAQLRLEAVKENYKSTYAQLAVDAENYAAATDDVSRKQHALNEKLEELGDSRYFVEPVSGAMIDLAEAEQKAYDEAVSGLEEIEGQYGSTQSAANRLEEQMKLNAMAAAEGASEFIKAADSNMQYKSAVQQCGVDLVSFTQHLEKMGFTTEQLASMQPQQVQALAKSWEGGTDKMIAACEEAGIEIPQALRDAAQGAKTSIEAETPNVVQSAYIMKDGVLQAYNPITGEFSDATLSAMAAVNSGIFGNTPLVIQSVADLEEGMVNVYNPVTGEMEQITLSAVQTAEGAIRNGEPGFTEAVNTMRANGTGTLQLIEGEWQLVGENATSNLGGGMNENMDVVEGAVDDAVSTVDGIKDAGSDSYTWGLHVIGNFARGISSGVGGVLSDAVNSAANMVADKIKFSEPKKGPLRRLDISGRHMVQNFTRGIERQMPEFQRTIDDIADVAAGGFNMRSSVSLSSHRMAKQPSSNGISVTVDQRGGMTESQVYSAVRSAMSDAISRQDGRPIVIQLNEREIARVVRNII